MTAALLLVCGGAVVAGTRLDRPQGIAVGHWTLAPYFLSSIGYDDNLFRAPDCGDTSDPLCQSPKAETVSRNLAGLAARLPVHNSLLELRYEAEKRDYSDYNPTRPLEQTGGALFQFRFGSGDQLAVSDTYTLGASDVRAFDEGGEFVFQDAPYNLNRIELAWMRTNPLRQGFVIRIARSDLNFVGGEPVPYFDYRGFESTFEYRQPVSGGRWFQVYYDSRRFNHYLANDPDSIGVPYRKEVADALQVGMAGRAGRNKPFNLRVGWGKFRLEQTEASYDGIVGSFDFGVLVASRTNVAVSLWRRPLPSGAATYYIVNSLRTTVERPFLRDFMVGVRLQLLYNEYGDALEGDEGKIREDQRYLLETYFDWLVHPRLAIRVAAGHQQRFSNFDELEFAATAASIGLRLGWF